MSVQKVQQYLHPFGLASRVMEFTVSSATVNTAALAVGCEPARIAKTLSFTLDAGAILVVLAGDQKIDNAKYKAFFHQKASMLPMERVEALTGFPVGGVCPFGVAEGVPVYLDESLRRFDFVYPAAGTASSAVRLSPEELYLASGAAGWVNIGKPIA